MEKNEMITHLKSQINEALNELARIELNTSDELAVSVYASVLEASVYDAINEHGLPSVARQMLHWIGDNLLDEMHFTNPRLDKSWDIINALGTELGYEMD